MSGAHILVVDDDPKVRTLLRRCFEGEGFTVSDAKDGSELRACLERNKIALITLDLNLGKENCLDLASGRTTTLPSLSNCASWLRVSVRS